jgi:hypothetical protein
VTDETTAVVLPDEQGIMSDNLVAIAQAAEKRVAAIRRIKAVALSVTNKNDWLDQEGRPYLWGSGAEKVARLFGISWRVDEPVLYVEDDGHYAYTYKGEFGMGVSTIEAIGSRSSRDPFFSRSHGQDVPLDKIDRQDVKKAAYTNCVGNGVTRLLGIRNLTWEEVEEFAKFKRGDTRGVKYQKAEMSEEAKDQRAELRRMILEMAGSDSEAAKDILLSLTTFVGRDGKEVAGKRRVDDLSERQVPVTYGKVKKAYEHWQATGELPQLGGGGPNGDAGDDTLF